MKNNLNMLREAIQQFENDGERSEFFYNNPKARLQLIKDVLEFTITKVDGIHDPTAISAKMNEIVKFLDNNYHGFEWSAHEVHFHTNFYQFAGCTYTCLPEISAMLEKLIRERFAA